MLSVLYLSDVCCRNGEMSLSSGTQNSVVLHGSQFQGNCSGYRMWSSMNCEFLGSHRFINRLMNQHKHSCEGHDLNLMKVYILQIQAFVCLHRKITNHIHWVFCLFSSCSMGKNSAPFVPYSYLFSDGSVIDKQPVRLVSSCSLNIYNFPFDIQNCTLSFNSYLHRGT